MKRWLLLIALLLLAAAMGAATIAARGHHQPLTGPPVEPPPPAAARVPPQSTCLQPHPPIPATPTVGWRGDGTGRYPDAHPPLHWSPTDNLLWKVAPLPAPASATPVPVGDRVFITSEPNRLLAFSARDGQLLWEREVSALETLSPTERAAAEAQVAELPGLRRQLDEAAERLVQLKRQGRTATPPPDIADQVARQAEVLRDVQTRVDHAELFGPPVNWREIGNASATPVTDGHFVYVVFGTFVVASFDLDGNRRWIRYLPHPEERRLEKEQLHVGGSPILVAGRLIVPMVELYGLDPATGQTVWTVPRFHHFGTPRATRLDGADVIVTPGGGLICAEDGVLLTPELRDNQQLAPVLTDSLVIVPGFFGNSGTSKMEAWPLPRLSDLTPDRDPSPPLWVRNLGTSEYWGTPLVTDGRILGLDIKGHLNVFDVQTGDLLKSIDLTAGLGGGGGGPSPVLAGDQLYLTANDGTTLVLESKEPYSTLARNVLPGDTRATLAAHGNRLYLRTADALYCVGQH